MFCDYLDPTLVVEISPSTLAVLDVVPYSTISVMCNVTQPQAVDVSKRISWKQTSPSGTVQTLNHNGIDINITTDGLDNPTSTSVLSQYVTMAGRWTYTCNVSIQVPGDPIISYSQTAEVTVTGIETITLHPPSKNTCRLKCSTCRVKCNAEFMQC